MYQKTIRMPNTTCHLPDPCAIHIKYTIDGEYRIALPSEKQRHIPPPIDPLHINNSFFSLLQNRISTSGNSIIAFIKLKKIFPACLCNRIIFSYRSVRGFLLAAFDIAVFFKACKHRIKRSLQNIGKTVFAEL